MDLLFEKFSLGCISGSFKFSQHVYDGSSRGYSLVATDIFMWLSRAFARFLTASVESGFRDIVISLPGLCLQRACREESLVKAACL